MAINIRPKKSVKKAPPTKKGTASKYKRGDRVYGFKSIHPPETAKRAKTRKEATANASNVLFEYRIIFGESSGKPEGQMTPMEKMVMVDRGVTKKDLESLKDKTKLDYDELANVLSVARATLINKKGGDKFRPPLSEIIVGLADLYSYG